MEATIYIEKGEQISRLELTSRISKQIIEEDLFLKKEQEGSLWFPTNKVTATEKLKITINIEKE